MSFCVRVEPVGLAVAEIEHLFLDHRIDAAQGIQIHDRDSPHISRLLDRVDIFKEIDPDLVRERLVRLDILRAEGGEGPVGTYSSMC